MTDSKIEVKSYFYKNIDDKLALVLLCKKHFKYSLMKEPEWNIQISNAAETRLICECDSKKQAHKLFLQIHNLDNLSLEYTEFLDFFPPFDENNDNPTYLNKFKINDYLIHEPEKKNENH